MTQPAKPLIPGAGIRAAALEAVADYQARFDQEAADREVQSREARFLVFGKELRRLFGEVVGRAIAERITWDGPVPEVVVDGLRFRLAGTTSPVQLVTHCPGPDCPWSSSSDAFLKGPLELGLALQHGEAALAEHRARSCPATADQRPAPPILTPAPDPIPDLTEAEVALVLAVRGLGDELTARVQGGG